MDNGVDVERSWKLLTDRTAAFEVIYFVLNHDDGEAIAVEIEQARVAEAGFVLDDDLPVAHHATSHARIAEAALFALVIGRTVFADQLRIDQVPRQTSLSGQFAVD